MRRFEYEDKTSSKFWEVTLQRQTLQVTFGRIGGAGQTKKTSFASAAQARTAYERLVSEKVRKGYVETNAKALSRATHRKPSAKTGPITALWMRVAKWLALRAPSVARKLAPAASPEQIERAEKTLGYTLPADVRELLMSHNGGQRAFAEHDLMSLDAIVDTARENRRLFGRRKDNTNEATPWVKGMWWNPLWVPFVMTAGGDVFCFDPDPGPKGRVGQIVLFEHDDSARTVVASSLRRWLENIVRDLDAGLYGFDEKLGFTPPVSGLGFGLSSAHGRDSLAILDAKRPHFDVPDAKKILVQNLEGIGPFRFGGRAKGPAIEIWSKRARVARWELDASRAIGGELTALRVNEQAVGDGFTVRISGVDTWPCFVSYQTYGDKPRSVTDDEVLNMLEPLTDKLESADDLSAFTSALKLVVDLAEECGRLGENAALVLQLIRGRLDRTMKGHPSWRAKPPDNLKARRALIMLAARLVELAPFPQRELIEVAAAGLFVVFESSDASFLRMFDAALVSRIKMDEINASKNGPILLFNLACAFGSARDKARMLHYVDLALRNGKKPSEFRVEMKPTGELGAFAKDPELLARLSAGRTAPRRSPR